MGEGRRVAQAGTWNMGGQACPPIDLTEVPRHVPRPALTTLSTLRESLLTTVGYSVLTTPPFPQFLPEDMFDMYVVGTQVPQGGGPVCRASRRARDGQRRAHRRLTRACPPLHLHL